MSSSHILHEKCKRSQAHGLVNGHKIFLTIRSPKAADAARSPLKEGGVKNIRGISGPKGLLYNVLSCIVEGMFAIVLDRLR